MSGYAVVDTKVAEQEADRERRDRGDAVRRATAGVDRRRASCARARSRCASATGTSSSRASSPTSRRVLYMRDIKERVRPPRRSCASTPIRTRSWSTGRSCGCSTATRHRPLPVLAVDAPEQPARRQRARHRLQLRAQLGEGDGRRLRRHDQVLRGRLDNDGTIEDPIIRAYTKAFPELFNDEKDMPRRTARALALPRGHVPRPDRAVHAVPHDRRERLLPQAVPLGHRAASRAPRPRPRRPPTTQSRQRRRPQHDARRIEHADRSAVL